MLEAPKSNAQEETEKIATNIKLTQKQTFCAVHWWKIVLKYIQVALQMLYFEMFYMANN